MCLMKSVSCVSRTSSIAVSTKIWSFRPQCSSQYRVESHQNAPTFRTSHYYQHQPVPPLFQPFYHGLGPELQQINIVTWYSACLQIILRDTNHASSFVPSSWQRGACDVWAENIRVLYLNYWFLAPSDLPIFDNFLVKSPLTDIFLLGSDTVFTMIIDNHHKEESLMLSHLPQLNCCCCSQ